MTDVEKIAELESEMSSLKERKYRMMNDLDILKEEIYSLMDRIDLIKRK
jgi:predicted  nucleic acid-binding Zn-ribbon protein